MKTEQIKISIIIPIYNAKEYISRCLDSLLTQTLQQIEIICVLDCPTDGTDKIVEQYARQDKRIVVLHNDRNSQVSKSRNRGLLVAKGEYIGFHDHDDYNIDSHMYEDLYRKAMQDDADVVLSDAIIHYAKTNHQDVKWRYCNIERDALIRANILPIMQTINPQQISHCVWTSVYRNDFLKLHNITFKDRNVYLDEDRLFNFEVFFYASKVSYIPKAYYVWEQLSESVSHNHPSYLASAQITRTWFYTDFLQQRGLLLYFQKDLWRLLSIEISIYKNYYENLSAIDKKRLRELMRTLHYPIFGYNYGIRIFGKKRLFLLWFNIKMWLL